MSHRRRATVAMVTYGRDLGGAERSLLTLAQLLPEHGLDPLLVCAGEGMAEHARDAGLTALHCNLAPPVRVSRRERAMAPYSARAIGTRATRSVKDSRTIARVLRDRRVDLVHSNSLPGHLPTLAAGKQSGTPVVWHLREIVAPGPGRETLSLLGAATAGIIAISDAVARSIRSSKVTTIHNPVAAPPTDVEPAEWAIEHPRVGYLGRIDPRKGIDELVRAMAGTDANLVVIGDDRAAPDFTQNLRALVQRTAPGRVHFVGPVADPWPALAALDVLVVPSREEPFGRVAAEGQRMGLPVIAARAGGLPEIVTHGEDGLLYESGDADSLAQRVRELLEDPELAQRLGSTARVTSWRFDPAAHAGAVAEHLWSRLDARR